MITLSNIEKQLGNFKLTIEKAAFYNGVTIVVGKNGAGKSTLLQLLATAQFPDNGEMIYNRQTVKTDLPIIRMDIGFLPSGIELYEEMNPKAFLKYMCELKGIDHRSEVPTLLDDFGLYSLQNKKIHKLSEGEKQRVAIAQAFLGLPRFLFLDEPFTYLDISERNLMISYLSHYAANHTVIVTTHELNSWADVCDNILWMDGGHIRFHGGPEQWVSSLPLSVWKGIISTHDLPNIQDETLIHSRIKDSKAHVRMIKKNNPDPAVFTETYPTIEDAYFIRKWSDENE